VGCVRQALLADLTNSYTSFLHSVVPKRAASEAQSKHICTENVCIYACSDTVAENDQRNFSHNDT
jgi:hypothetical protein